MAARLLGVSNRGWVALIVLVVTVITLIGSAGLPAAMTFSIARDPGAAPALIRSVQRILHWQIGLSLLVQAAVLALLLHHAPHAVRAAGVISLAAAPAIVLWQFQLSVLQGLQRFGAWNVLRFAPAVGYSGAMVVLWIAHAPSVLAVLSAWTAFVWLGCIWSRRACSRALAPGLVPPMRRELPGPRSLLRYGLAALLGSASPLQTFNLDQAIVGLFLDPAALGIYVVAVAFTNLPYFVGQGIGAVGFARIASMTPDDARRAIFEVAGIVLLSVCVMVGLLELALPWLVPHLFGEAFRRSVPVARILLLYAILVAMRRVLGDCARAVNHPGLSTADELVALVCLVPATALLVHRGPDGVALAMLIAAAAGLLVVLGGLVIRLSAARPTAPSRAISPLEGAEPARSARHDEPPLVTDDDHDHDHADPVYATAGTPGVARDVSLASQERP